MLSNFSHNQVFKFVILTTSGTLVLWVMKKACLKVQLSHIVQLDMHV